MDYDSKKDAVDRVIEQSDEELDKYGKSYYDNLEQVGETGAEVQIRYMAANAGPELAEKLRQIADGEDPDDIEPSDKGKMTLEEIEAISREFERHTEETVSAEGELGVDEFEAYANKKDIAVEKVFVASPWTKSVLTDKAARKEQYSNQEIDIED